MTDKQKRIRIALIEQDVQRIMEQLDHIDMKIEMDLQRRPEIMNIFGLGETAPKSFKSQAVKEPSVFKKLWTGFMQELKQ